MKIKKNKNMSHAIFTDFSSENISSILYSYNTSEKKKLVSETMNFPVEGSRL